MLFLLGSRGERRGKGMTTLYGGKSATPPCVSQFCRKENRRSHICPASQNTRWSHRACRPMAGSSAAKRGRRRLYSIPMVLPPEGARYGPSRSRTMGTRLSLPPDCRTTPPKLPARGRQSPASSLTCASTGIVRPFRRFIIIATFGAKVKGFSQKTRRFFGENRENSSPSGYCAPRPFRPQNVGAKGRRGVYIINRCKKPTNSARMPPKSLCIAQAFSQKCFFTDMRRGKNTVTRPFCPTMQGICGAPEIQSVFGK